MLFRQGMCILHIHHNFEKQLLSATKLYLLLLLLLELYLPSDYNIKFTKMQWSQQKIRELSMLPAWGLHASRPDCGKLPTRKT